MAEEQDMLDKKKSENGSAENKEPCSEDHKKPRPKDSRQRNADYKKSLKQNEQFEVYYKAQGIVPEGEWDEFMEALRKPLPSAFRITGTKTQAQELLKMIKSDFFDKLCDVEVEGRKIQPPKCLSWYPDQLAWQLDLDRNIIRKSEMLSKLHAFLIEETESGNISRQESVSMIPPLLMDIQPHHKVLDMCAAPGSKTAQLIEYLHAGGTNLIPGCVVANDSDNKRCYLMTHQVKRLESPNFLIINHDATCLPNFKYPLESNPKLRVAVRFDRILADVPCSGDGTFRKNMDAWQKWHQHKSMQLHNIQKRILNRGLEMLDVGGRLVYSTCSMNPIEDEAVVCSMLKKCDGAARLVDVSQSLPGLKFLSGMSSWKVISRDMTEYDTPDSVPDYLLSTIRPSVFPPSPAEAEQMNLHRCIRVLPHHQNTGGFFIAVLEKTADVPWVKVHHKPMKQTLPQDDKMEIQNVQSQGGETQKNLETVASENVNSEIKESSKTATGDIDEKSAHAENVTDGTSSGEVKYQEEKNATDTTEKRKCEGQQGQEQKRQKTEKKRKGIKGYKEDPFIFISENDEVWPPIQEFFGLEDFPADQLMVRCAEGKKRHLYFTSKLIKSLVQQNEGVLKFINMGLKIFSRSDSPHAPCPYRTVQDGVSLLNTYVTKRKASITKEDIITLLSSEMPFLSKFTKDFQDQLSVLCQGSVVFVYDPNSDPRPDSPKCQMILCGWLGRTSCRSFIPLNDRGHYLRLCGAALLSKSDRKKELEEFKQRSMKHEQGSPAKADNVSIPEVGDVQGVLEANNDDIQQENNVLN